MRRIASLLLLLVMAVAARADFAVPDFAYPQTVVGDAEAVLASSTGKADGLTRLRAVMEIVTAKGSISRDSLYLMPGFISRQAAMEQNADARGLMKLYEARVLNEIYNRASWRYDQVVAPLSPLPANPSEWSGDQFRTRIKELVDSSIMILSPSMTKPIGKFKEVVALGEGTTAFYPYLRDFVYQQAVEIVSYDSKKLYVETALDMTTRGTPEWAIWTAQWLSPEDLLESYKENPGGIAGGYLLWKASQSNEAHATEIVGFIREYLAANMPNDVTDALKSRLKEMTVARVTVNVPNMAQTSVEFAVDCEYSYTDEVGVKIYRETNPTSGKYPPAKTLVGTFTRKVDGNEANGKITVPVKIDKSGNYLVYGICGGVKENNGGYVSLIVAPWVPIAVTHDKESVVIAAKSADGAPAKGVKVGILPVRGHSSINVGTTNAEGYIAFSRPKSLEKRNGANPLMLSEGGTSVYYGYNANVGGYAETLRDNWIACNIMVSRPIYHPGDTVEWGAVAVEKSFKPVSSALARNVALQAVFRDANGTPVDTIDVVTDAYGRVNGKFSIPDNLLSGRFRIQLMQGRQSVANASVMVSDFKAPVFELTGVDVNYDDSAYVLTGRAVRYSGAGVPDAEVTAEITNLWPFYRYSAHNGDEQLPKITGTTDADGRFRIEVPMAHGQEGCYTCNVTVTSASADIATAAANFRVGKPYLVTGETDGGELNVDDPITLSIMAYDAKMKAATVQAKWELSDSADSTKTVVSAPCMIDSLGLKVDWNHVPAGIYELRVVPVDTAMFKPVAIGKVVLYSFRRNDVPEKVNLLLPKNEEAVSGDMANVIVGVGSDRYVYAIMFGKDGKPTVKLQKLTRGFHTMSFVLDGRDTQRIAFATVADGKVDQKNFTINRAQPSRKLTLKGESWRDKVVPGMREEWKIKLTDASGKGLPGAMIATMYNRSLNALSSLSWPTDLATFISAPQLHEIYNISFPVCALDNIWKSGRVSGSVSPKIFRPVFEFCDYYGGIAVTGGNGLRIRGAAKLAMNSCATTTESVEEEVADYSAAVPMMKSVKESADEAADAGASAEEPEEFKFREGEVLQALWMPDITVDTAGEATLRFVVPDAIGSWAFRASAWTEDCRAAEMLADLVASKPVMVQPSLPRFLRQGDKARVLATVINNTDSAQTVTTTVEIFDVVSGAVIDRHDETLALWANGQGLVGIDIEAPVDASMIGYRVKSSTGDFADGEQSMIPVLEATTMAIDSEVFYLNDAEPTFSMTIPADAKGNDIVALQYCQNPVWDVVKSLPGLYDFEPKTACGAAASVYAALTAKNLLKKFPEIREVLKIWQASPADSALVSKLEKNEDLKLAMLAQTPFVGAANANSAQMQRLATTFNEKDIERVLKASLSVLEKLQLADGGFAWGRWSENSSPWITMAVLTTIGQLNEGGAMPEDGRLDAIVNRGLAYLDKDVEGAVDYSYTRLYSLFPGHKPSTLKGQRSIDKTVQEIVADWKKMQTAAKGRDALILNAFGNKAVASEIMESVAQFAVTNGKRGVSFPSVRSVDSYCSLLHAFALIKPQSSLIDGMRQWLVLQTQTTDDLGAWNPTALVSAILSTGARWTSLPTDATASVTIDGQPLEIGKVEAATGAFSERIPSSSKKRTITFTRPDGGQPAYGSVLTIGKRPMSEVKARASELLSVTKRFLVERGGKWVETDRFVLGERVRVQLMVKASDNMEYVTIDDQRPAAFEPVDQIPGWMSVATLRAYRENSDTKTRLFINWLPKGTYYLTYDMTAAYTGSFASGAATIQSQYAPEMTARSGANTITVTSGK